MADDLVQRLRDIDNIDAPCSRCQSRRSAVDEIERLRAEVAKVKRLYADCDGCLGRTLARAETAERELAALREMIEKAPVAIMDTRDVLGICAPAEEDFPALYAMQGHRVRLVRED